jgi:hypothetical protein
MSKDLYIVVSCLVSRPSYSHLEVKTSVCQKIHDIFQVYSPVEVTSAPMTEDSLKSISSVRVGLKREVSICVQIYCVLFCAVNHIWVLFVVLLHLLLDCICIRSTYDLDSTHFACNLVL